MGPTVFIVDSEMIVQNGARENPDLLLKPLNVLMASLHKLLAYVTTP